MATIRLIPSTYAVSNSTYLSVSNPSNMYHNTDNTSSYATVTNSRASTTSYYLYLRGFNFNDIPDEAEINSFSVKLRAYESGLSTSTSYAPRLANGTSTLSSTTASSTLGTTTKVITIPTGALTWQQIVNYGGNFTIMIYVRRANSNTTGYAYIQGAEIEVNYTIPTPRTITSTLTGSGTIDPSGSITTYDGEIYDLIITPTNTADQVHATKNGTDITSQLVYQAAGSHSENTVLGEYTLVSGSFNGSGATYFQGLVGKGHTSSATTSNYYSGGSGTIAVFTYDVGITGIPDNATITRVYALVNGHAESTSNSNEYMCAQLRSGSTQLSTELNFKSVGTSNSTQTIEATVLPTAAQLQNMVLYCRLGYYGGALNGATIYVEYSVAGGYYVYSYTVSGDATINVVIGSQQANQLYLKVNGAWVGVSNVYLKQNGSWVEQSNLASLFDTDTIYIKG